MTKPISPVAKTTVTAGADGESSMPARPLAGSLTRTSAVVAQFPGNGQQKNIAVAMAKGYLRKKAQVRILP